MDGDEWIVAGFAVTCLILFFIFAISFNCYTCKTKAEMQELEWSYGPVQGCMVREKDGKWIDYQRLRYMEN